MLEKQPVSSFVTRPFGQRLFKDFMSRQEEKHSDLKSNKSFMLYIFPALFANNNNDDYYFNFHSLYTNKMRSETVLTSEPGLGNSFLYFFLFFSPWKWVYTQYMCTHSTCVHMCVYRAYITYLSLLSYPATGCINFAFCPPASTNVGFVGFVY